MYSAKKSFLAIPKKSKYRGAHNDFKPRNAELKSIHGNRNPQIKNNFDVEKCKICPFRFGCYKEGSKSKTYCVPIKSTEHLEQEAFQNTEEFKQLAKERYKIEAKNSELVSGSFDFDFFY